MAGEALHDFTDRALREMLARPENLREFLAAAVPDLADGFDVDRMRPAPREYFLGNWRRRSPDLLFEIPYRTHDSETLALVCVLLEHQSKTDWQVPLKTFVYAALYWEWQWRTWEETPAPQPDFALTPVLPMVLHTGPRPWASARSLRELLAPPAAFHAFVPDWQPLFWELATHPAEELLNGRAAFLQALTILKADDSELADAERLFGEVFQRIDPLHETGRGRWAEMLHFLMGWAHHKRPAGERPSWHSLAVQLQTTADRKREIESMGMTIAESIFQEGRQEGWQKGREEGKLQQTQAILNRLARRRFNLSDETVRSAIERIVDVDRLEHMTERVGDVVSLEELLAIS
jgi:Putative transposase, YhgA-like